MLHFSNNFITNII